MKIAKNRWLSLSSALLAIAVAARLSAQQPDSASRAPMRMEHGQDMMGAMGGLKGGMGGMMGGMGGLMGHMMEMGGGAMMRGLLFSPAHLLMHKEALGLTDQQVGKLTALRDAAKTGHDAGMTEQEKHAKALQAALTAATPDTVAVKAHFEEMQAGLARAQWAMLSAAAQARAVLTEVQRARVDGWGDAMEFMAGMGGEEGPGHDGMMHPHHE